MQAKVAELGKIYKEKLAEIENSSTELKGKLQVSFVNSQNNLNALTAQLNQYIKNFENPSEQLVQIIAKKVSKAERSIQKLAREIRNIVV